MVDSDLLSAGTSWQQPWMLLFSGRKFSSRHNYQYLGETNLHWFDIGFISKEEFVREARQVNSLAWPMTVASLSQFLLRFSAMFVLGYVGELSLSGASMATSFCNVTGFSVIYGMASALETLYLILPMLWSSIASLFADILLCWAFVFKLKLGSFGVVLSIGLCFWLNVLLLGFYVMRSSSCEKTYAPFSKEIFLYVGRFVQYAVPSALMVCLEWWCFEVVILLCGMLPNPLLEVNVLAICMTITALHFNISYSFGAAASTRISNELRAGKPDAARRKWRFTLKNGAVALPLHHIGQPASSTFRGAGWQRAAAYANLGAYYLVGIPVALLMGFAVDLKGLGLWIGLVAGSAVQCFLFSLVTCLTDWEKQATEARKRIFEGIVPAQIELTRSAERLYVHVVE